jgi:hypothetical protein
METFFNENLGEWSIVKVFSRPNVEAFNVVKYEVVAYCANKVLAQEVANLLFMNSHKETGAKGVTFDVFNMSEIGKLDQWAEKSSQL